MTKALTPKQRAYWATSQEMVQGRASWKFEGGVRYTTLNMTLVALPMDWPVGRLVLASLGATDREALAWEWHLFVQANPAWLVRMMKVEMSA